MPKPEDDGLLQRLEQQLAEASQRRAGPLIEKVVEQVVEQVKGDPGLSAYEVAVANGFVGTEAEWLESLHGRDGEDGKDGEDGQSIKGDPGKAGKDGKDGRDGRDAPAPPLRRWAFAVLRDNNGLINEVIATPL